MVVVANCGPVHDYAPSPKPQTSHAGGWPCRPAPLPPSSVDGGPNERNELSRARFAPLLVVEADADATHGRRPVDVARSLVAGTMPTDGGRAELNLIDLQALCVCWIGTNDDASSTNNVRAHC